MDAAHHDRFILHGAGYDPRYRAGLDPALHGIFSDDYAATEVLTGHPAMVSRAFGRDVVRMYWLMQPMMRALPLPASSRPSSLPATFTASTSAGPPATCG